ncbi:Ribosomal protein S18 acetylase RimI [Andreprevotia lacus DSM 23236]|jgi:ribosomal protein S18 acetylase RimI-like enzyme|uniref:Ribosomal protein S18 acetylase RimI n=1 Tax=Andreprevotia lacus DSM 23236 TaxID=1121001 RepID=A0A1W1Y0B0_9NEIS|nr:GNAT family N-acetyltransferase [Andreprevotia lacus]SMC29659.1 Ribosomal protein S18 acetylase RimI [Andreprevotia lacus DSM 23236]
MHIDYPGLALRPVTDNDRELLIRIYRSTREEELRPTGWSDEQKTQFIAMQFQAQHQAYSAYANAEFLIVEHDGTPVGRIYLQHKQTVLHIIDLSLLPAARNLGMGTALLQACFASGASSGKAVHIHVEKFNPALQLYLRLGFQICEDKGIYLSLERETATAQA